MTDYINRRDSIRNFERWIEDHDYIKCPKCGVMVKWEFTFSMMLEIGTTAPTAER